MCQRRKLFDNKPFSQYNPEKFWEQSQAKLPSSKTIHFPSLLHLHSEITKIDIGFQLIKCRIMKDLVARKVIGGLACQLASHYRCI